MKRTVQFVAPLASLALTVGLMLNVRAYAAHDDSGPFHERVRETVDRIPARIGKWEGADEKLPTAATKLLKPNKTLCRLYRHDETGHAVKLLLVQCRDARDMTGHYPPVCYPVHGWTVGAPPRQETVELWGRPVTFGVYQFSRSELDRFVDCVIYDVFVLPRAGLVTGMDDVNRASADYRARPYGAAQLQVIFDAGVPRMERAEMLREVLAPLEPAVEAMQLRDGGAH